MILLDCLRNANFLENCVQHGNLWFFRATFPFLEKKTISMTILLCAKIPLKMRLILSNPQSYVLSNSIHKSIKTIFLYTKYFCYKSNKKPQHVWKWRRSSYQPKKETVKVSNVQKEAISCFIFSILSPQLFLFLSLFSLIAIWRFTFQNVSNFFTIISYFLRH